MTRRERMMREWARRQDNVRGMGLARDVLAGQAQPVKRGRIIRPGPAPLRHVRKPSRSYRWA